MSIDFLSELLFVDSYRAILSMFLACFILSSLFLFVNSSKKVNIPEKSRCVHFNPFNQKIVKQDCNYNEKTANIYKFSYLIDRFYMSLIYQIFHLANQPYEMSYKQLNESRCIKIQYKKADDLNKKIESIFSRCKTIDQVSMEDYVKLELFLNEIAINGIMKDAKKAKELVKLLDLSTNDLENKHRTYLNTFYQVETLQHIKLMLFGLSNELEIKITLFDVKYTENATEYEEYTIKPKTFKNELFFAILDDAIYPMILNNDE